MIEGGFFTNCKRIDDAGITEVAPPKLTDKSKVVTTPPKQKAGKKKIDNSCEAVRTQIQEADTILSEVKDRSISNDEKNNVLKNLVRATDIVRCLTPADDPTSDEEIETLVAVWKERGYYAEQTEHGIKLVLPPVLHKKAVSSNVVMRLTERKYNNDDIGRFLQEEKRRLGLEANFLMNQVLVFTHERVDKGQFDYDNLSTSGYINAITDCFLAADNAMNIDFFQRFVRGEENRTIVHIIPRENFSKWVRSRY